MAPSLGAENRQAWLFETLAAGPSPSTGARAHSHVLLTTQAFMGTGVGRALGILDLSWFEVQLGAYRTLALQSNQRNEQYRALINDINSGYSLGVSRSFTTESEVFGSIGFALHRLMPKGTSVPEIKLATGLGARDGAPWSMHLETSYFMSVPLEGASLNIKLAIDYTSVPKGGTGFEIGGRLGWAHRLFDNAEPGEYEHICATFAPGVGYLMPGFKARVEVPFRLFVDKLKQVQDGNVRTEYPTEGLGPNLFASVEAYF